ncbi:MAG: LacI family DNA-binding transcriptional regulator [Microbacterium sp.]
MGGDADSVLSAAPGKPATIYDVAKLAGVSHQTVSRHLRGLAGIRPETRERVVRALEQLDYRPNLTARNLATSRSHRVGVLTHEIGEVGPSRILQGAGAGARDAGYLLDIVSLEGDDPAAAQEALSLIARQDIAGLLVFTSTDAMTRALRETPVRVPTIIEVEDDDAVADHPETWNYRGLRVAVDHLVSLGHRRFFHIAGPPGWVSARNRILSYERALASHGLASLGSTSGDWSAASGYRAAQTVPFDAGVTAIVVANDQMALGTLRALTERGIRVPEDVSITGFDDTPESAFYSPPLTTVHGDFDLQGRAVFARLLRLIESGVPDESVRAPARLVLRGSTASPPRD